MTQLHQMGDMPWILGLPSHVLMDTLYLDPFHSLVKFKETGMKKHQHAAQVIQLTCNYYQL